GGSILLQSRYCLAAFSCLVERARQQQRWTARTNVLWIERRRAAGCLDGLVPVLLLHSTLCGRVCVAPFLEAGERRDETLANERVELAVKRRGRDAKSTLDCLCRADIVGELLQQRHQPLEAPTLFYEQADEPRLNVRDSNLRRITRPDKAGVEILDR